MKSVIQYINERLKINKDTQVNSSSLNRCLDIDHLKEDDKVYIVQLTFNGFGEREYFEYKIESIKHYKQLSHEMLSLVVKSTGLTKIPINLRIYLMKETLDLDDYLVIFDSDTHYFYILFNTENKAKEFINNFYEKYVQNVLRIHRYYLLN